MVGGTSAERGDDIRFGTSHSTVSISEDDDWKGGVIAVISTSVGDDWWVASQQFQPEKTMDLQHHQIQGRQILMFGRNYQSFDVCYNQNQSSFKQWGSARRHPYYGNLTLSLMKSNLYIHDLHWLSKEWFKLPLRHD